MIKQLVIVIAMFSIEACMYGQEQLDYSGCISSHFVDSVDYTSDVRFALATLAQITESTFEASKHDLALAGRYGIISGSLDYSTFDTRRSEYFSLNKLDLSYYKSVSLSSRVLNARAYATIDECVRQAASRQYGLHYIAVVNDETSASLQFFWRGTPGSPSEIAVLDSVLENATAAGAPSGKLFPSVAWWQFFTSNPAIGEGPPVILLRRIDTNKPIVASITTRPQVRSIPIRIDPVPKIAVEPICKTVYDTKDPATGKDYAMRRAFALHDHITDKHGCPDCHGFLIGVEAPGPIYDHSCENSDPYAHIEICTAENNHVTLSGFQNSDGMVYINVLYKIPRVDCIFPKK